MRKAELRPWARVCLLAGCVLILAAGVLGSVRAAGECRVRRALPELTQSLAALIPERTQAVSGMQTEMRLPAIELGGEMLCGLMEVSESGVMLPVFASFDRTNGARRPAVYGGSPDAGTLILGGNADCFAFAQTLQGGETIRFTDLTGRTFSYVVGKIRHAKSLAEGLSAETAELTLFVRLHGSYLMVFCGEAG